MDILLVEPNFPLPTKTKNHRSFLPIGLLKLASYYRNNGNKIKLVKGNQELNGFKPDKIMITSLFTYWSKYVKESVQFYKEQYPEAKIIVGGIYASLMPEHCKKYTGCDQVFKGVHKTAEKLEPAYDLIDVDYQIIHASRGCTRRCPFCGTWKIEPEFIPKKSIKNEIRSNKLIFYDNNLLANPYIENILNEIANTKYNGKAIICESQCGFDGRLIQANPKLAELIKRARFQNVRIAWDWKYSEWKNIKKQLDILNKVGYNYKDMYVFMLYNWEIPFKEMERKRKKCWEWGVQIADCRYRPLNQTFDNYNPRRKQTNKDYYIHPKWTDKEVKQFRKNVRRQNICVRLEIPFHSRILERKGIKKKFYKKIRSMPKSKVKKILPDAWFPRG